MYDITRVASKTCEFAGGLGLADADLIRPEALDQARIEDLIAENLKEQLKVIQVILRFYFSDLDFSRSDLDDLLTTIIILM